MGKEGDQIQKEQQKIDKFDDKVDKKVALNGKDYSDIVIKKVDDVVGKIDSNFGIKEQAFIDSPKFKEVRNRAFSDTFKILQEIDKKNIGELTVKLETKLNDILKEFTPFTEEEKKITKFKSDLTEFNTYMEKRREYEKNGKFSDAEKLTKEYQSKHVAATEQASPLESANFQAEKKYQEVKNTLGDAEKITEILKIAQGYIDQANQERKFEQQEGFRVGFILQGPTISGNGDAVNLPGELINTTDGGEGGPIADLASIVEIDPTKGVRIVMLPQAMEGTKENLKQFGVAEGWVKPDVLRKAISAIKMKFSHCEEGMTHCVTPKLEGKSLETAAKAQDLVEEANTIKAKMELMKAMEQTTITSERAIKSLWFNVECKNGKPAFTPKFLADFDNEVLANKKSGIRLAQESLLKATIIEATEKADPVSKEFYLGQEALSNGKLPEARFRLTKFLYESSVKKDQPEFKEMIKFAEEKVKVFNIASIKRLQKINDQLSDSKRYQSLLKDPANERFLYKFTQQNKANLEAQLQQSEAGTIDTKSQYQALIQRREQTISATPISSVAAYGGIERGADKDNSDQLRDAWNSLVYAEFSTGVESDSSKIQDEYLSAARTLRELGQTDISSEYFEAAMKDDIEQVRGTISEAQKEQMRAKIIEENEKKRPDYEAKIRQKMFSQIEEFNAKRPAELQKPLEISSADLKALVDEAMAEGVEEQIKKVVMHGMEIANNKGILEKGSKKAWGEYESMMDVNDKWYIISDKGAEKIAEQVFINGVIMALSGGVGALASASVRAFMIANGVRSGLALGAAGFVSESVGFELANRTIHSTILGEKGLFMPADLAKGIGQSMLMFGAIGGGNKLWGAVSEASGLVSKEAMAGAGTAEKLLRHGANWTGQLATESAVFTATSDNSFIESAGDILMLRVGGKLVSPITGAMHEASQKIIEKGVEKGQEREQGPVVPQELTSTIDPDLQKKFDRRQETRQPDIQRIREYWEEITEHSNITNSKDTETPEAHKAQAEMISFLREEINLGMPPDLEAMWEQVRKTPLTPEQRSMTLATIQHMLRVKNQTGMVMDEMEIMALRRLGVAPGERPQRGDPKPLDDMRKKVFIEKLAEKMHIAPFKGNIDYKEIDGVLVLRCENNEDFAKISDIHPGHIPAGIALTPEENGLGISLIVIRSDQEFNENRSGVIRHELQHIFKQGSNNIEEGRLNYNNYSSTFQNGRSYFDEHGNLSKERVQEYLNIMKGDMHVSFKDEALAFLRTSHHQGLNNMMNGLHFTENNGYDYFNSMREVILKNITKARPELIGDAEFVKGLNATIDQHRAEYRTETKEWLDGIENAVKALQDSGMTEMQARDHVADLLMFVQLKEWGKKLKEIGGVKSDAYNHAAEEWFNTAMPVKENTPSKLAFHQALIDEGITAEFIAEAAQKGHLSEKGKPMPPQLHQVLVAAGLPADLIANLSQMGHLIIDNNSICIINGKESGSFDLDTYKDFLIATKEVYGSDLKKFNELHLLGMGDLTGDAIIAASSIYKGSVEKFNSIREVITELYKQRKFSELKSLAAAKTVYENNPEMFDIFLELAKTKRASVIDALVQAKEIYGDDLQMFQGFVEVGKISGDGVEALIDLQGLYKGDMGKFEEVKKSLIELGRDKMSVIGKIATVCSENGNDIVMFRGFVEAAKLSIDGMWTIIDMKGLFEGDIKKFEEVKNGVIGVEQTRLTEIEGSYIPTESLSKVKEICGDNLLMFQGFVEVGKVASNGINVLIELKGLYEGDMNKFERVKNTLLEIEELGGEKDLEFKELIGPRIMDRIRGLSGEERIVELSRALLEVTREERYKARALLVQAKELFGNNLELFLEFANLAKKINGGKTINMLIKMKGFHGGNTEIMRVLVESKLENIGWDENQINDPEVMRLLAESKLNDIDWHDLNLNYYYHFIKQKAGNDMGKLREFIELGKLKEYNPLINLCRIVESYGDNREVIEGLIKVGKIDGGRMGWLMGRLLGGPLSTITMEAFSGLVEIAALTSLDIFYKVAFKYNKDRDIFSVYMEVAKLNDGELFLAIELGEFMSKGNIEMLRGFLELAKSGKKDSLKEMVKIEEAYGDNMEIFNEFMKVAKAENGALNIRALYAARRAYGGHTVTLHNRRIGTEPESYKGDINRFKQIKDDVLEIAKLLPEKYLEGALKDYSKWEGMPQAKREQYAEVIRKINEAPSQELQRVANELVAAIMESDDPIGNYNKIEEVFIKNNLPLVGKIFKVFNILHPSAKMQDILARNPTLSPYLREASQQRRVNTIFTDLLRIHVETGNRSLQQYLEILKEGENLFAILERSGNQPIEPRDIDRLQHYVAKLNTLFLSSPGGQMAEGHAVNTEASISEIREIYGKLKESLGVRGGQTVNERVIEMFASRLGYKTIDEVLAAMKNKKQESNERGLALVASAKDGQLAFQNGDLIKGVNEAFIGSILQNGSVAKEYLGGSSSSDMTPYDTDVARLDGIQEGKNFNGILSNSIANNYGDILFVIRDRGQFVKTEAGNGKSADPAKFELFKTGAAGESHYGIRTGFAATEIDYVISRNPTNEKLFLEIAQNGYYIPVVDANGKIIFTPEQYNKYRKIYEGLDRFDGADYERQQAQPNERQHGDVAEIKKGLDEQMAKVKEESTHISSAIQEVLSSMGITLKSEFDTSILGAELMDTGSTGRHTNMSGNFDFDLALKIDLADEGKIPELVARLKAKLAPNEDKSHAGNGGSDLYQLRFIGAKGLDGNPVDIDIAFVKKSELSVYGSHDAVRDKLEWIREHHGEDAYKEVVANIILAKKVLKDSGAYKKVEDGGMGGIGVENWILANGGNFREAARTFWEAAHENGVQLSLEEFQKRYSVIDPGINVKFMGHDNFIRILKAEGYNKMLQAIENYFSF